MEGEPYSSHRHPLAHPSDPEHHHHHHQHHPHQQLPPTAALPPHGYLPHHHQPPPTLLLHAPPPSSAAAAAPHPRGCCCCSSDSGVSSASSSSSSSSSSRCYSSGSGDERCSSGSRASSALSAEERSGSAHEEPPASLPRGSTPNSSGNPPPSSSASRTGTPPYPPSPASAPSPSSRFLPYPSSEGKSSSSSSNPRASPQTSSSSAAESVRVWRDPALVAAQRVRHIQSVQHQTLMSHPPSSSPSASSTSSVVFSAGGAAPAPPGAAAGAANNPSAPSPASSSSAPPPSSAATTSIAAASHAAAAAAAAAAALSLHPTAAPHHPHAHHYPPPPPLLGSHHPHALHHGAALALAAAAAPPLYSQLPEMLWKPRYAPLPPGPASHLLPPGHEELLERERAFAQDRHERLLRERREQEARELEKQHKERERAERERAEREKAERERREQQERERMEKRAAEQAVHKHFEESLRLAHQKQRSNMCWSLINSLPPPPRSAASVVAEETERKRAEHEQRLLAARDRERVYYATIAAQHLPPGSSAKLEYPPPPAHSRMVEKSSEKNISGAPGGHSPLPKVEPNFNLFGYQGYQPPTFLSPEKVKVDSKSPAATTASQLVSSQPLSSSPAHPHHHAHSITMGIPRELPNPPPLTSDLSKNSVIVKNDGKQQQMSKIPHSHHQPQPSHLHGKSVGPQSYEYHQRSPTRSPIGLHHASHHPVHHHHPSSHHQHQTSPHHQSSVLHLPSEPQNLAKGSQAPVHGQPSSHASQERASPYGTPTSNHLSYNLIGQSKANSVTNPYQVYSAPSLHPASQTGPVSHFAHSAGGSSTTSSSSSSSTLGNKPKVSSPAPPHIYGRPTAGVGSGASSSAGRTMPAEVAPSPVYPLPLTAKSHPYPTGAPHSTHSSSAPTSGPPPAHSGSDPRPYDPRAYPPTPITRPSTVQAVTSHPTQAPRRLVNQLPSVPPIPPAVHRNSPRHEPAPPVMHAGGNFQTQPLDLGVSDRSRDESNSPKRKGVPDRGNAQDSSASKKRRSDTMPISSTVMPPAVLARVSEPGPLVASAAASITTVVNTSLGAIPPEVPVVPPSSVVSSCRKAVGTIPRVNTPQDDSVNPVIPRPPETSSPAAKQVPTSSSSGTSSTPIPPSSPNSQSARPPSVGGTESEKSNSPGPSRSVAPQSVGPSYPVHKLKKAWLQRHSGEDGADGSVVSRNGGSAFPCSPPTSQSSTAASSTVSDSSSRRNQPLSPPRAKNSTKGRPGSENQGGSGKGSGKRGARETSTVTPNGHTASLDSVEMLEDSSSSDADCKSPTKRKVWKSKKRKKGATRGKATDETPTKRRAGAGEGESQSESEKESGSDKESDSGGSTGQGRGGRGGSGGGGGSGTGSGGAAGRGTEGKEPRRRGRRPKAKEERARQSGGGVGGGSSSTQSQCAPTANDCNSTRPMNSLGQVTNSTDSSRGVASNNGRGGGARKGRGGGAAGEGSGGGDPPRRDPCRKPPVSQLKKTGESFLQDGSCFEVAPKLAKCRECRWTPNQRSRNMTNIFCRFFAFRRLRYTKNGQLAMAGFSDPHGDASEDDLKLWLPQSDNPPEDLDIEMSRFLLSQVGDQFCDLVEQEKDAISLHMSEDKTIAWKRVVQGVREMCDVCETTLFNYHWACGKCGFVVCIDCYKGRKNGTIKIWEEAGKDRDDFSWLLCTNRQAHEQEKLMLTQIIADDALLNLGAQVHSVRQQWGISQYCRCISNKEQKGANGIAKDLLKNLIKCENLNGVVKSEKNDEVEEVKSNLKKNGAKGSEVGDDESKNSPLNWLADVALSNEDKKLSEGSVSSSDSEDDKENYSTLRELLIRPSNATGGSSGPASPAQQALSPQKPRSRPSSPAAPATKKSRLEPGDSIDTMDTLDQVISSAIRDVAGEKTDPTVKGEGNGSGEEAAAPIQLKHFIRRFSLQSREPLPIRIMTLTESMAMYPDVPHSWLCDGKLLHLHDPNNANNYRIFQDQWKRGQPVIVSDVTKSLDATLWHPDSFARDFGDDKNDLINCTTGNIVPNQPMRRFWEGFEVISRRLRDDKGQPMLLKLKDWPPGEDFAETLPARFADLMKALPLTEYTHRNGRLNIASRLPECFVRPDLGPKMYNAYGSTSHPTKGTTNLHLDVSDAVNVMVYVGIPQDATDVEDQNKDALRAIEEAGCDILTRRRVKEKGMVPGALWHIYAARDADRIRDLLNKVAIEQGARLEPHHDPIHDQSWYLDGKLRERLYTEYGVEGFALVQCLGDAVFIPAGAPHQVRNLHSCIKVAEDFVSPENVSHCFHLTQEFRELSDTHTNHEDKLQIKNIIYHAVKDSLSVLLGNVKSEEEKNGGDEKEGVDDGPLSTPNASGDGEETSGNQVTIKEEKPDT
ncbi:lysine-specific demethylase 3B-like isoform X4 [Ischnura elegans]|uniref:lysine-specific demethylase 3B-like isoform X4 n=2 Tax=Ischnura elegans TaxID=197161 RepID=UPI001ED87DDD|nr:lysine-specific demethylase 3B-like isoform X4 [Ischnura elegans]XP_046386732.1 lysine-specific demethylase 3B-like isoform X4 [Ischnura elegans]